MKNSSKILFIIFFVAMIPNIFVYGYHALHELNESKASFGKGLLHKSSEQEVESLFFTIVAGGYFFMTLWIIMKPYDKFPYYVILIGTVIIIIIYYLSKTTGIIAPDGYDNVILDDTTNWKDLITKICQQILVIPISILLIRISQRDL